MCDSAVNISTNLTYNLFIGNVRIHSLPALAIKDAEAFHLQIVINHNYKITTKIKTHTSAWLPSHSHAKSKIIQYFKCKKKKGICPQAYTLSSIIPQYRNECLSYKCVHLDPLQSLIWKCLKHNTVKPCAIKHISPSQTCTHCSRDWSTDYRKWIHVCVQIQPLQDLHQRGGHQTR